MPSYIGEHTSTTWCIIDIQPSTHSMGNPTSGSKVQMTMSLSKNRHRQSRSVASLSLEKLAQQERNNSVEKGGGGTFSPGGTGEKSVAAFLAEKKPKRRTRSSLGGTEEIVKHLEPKSGALQSEERKLLNFVSFRGKPKLPTAYWSLLLLNPQ